MGKKANTKKKRQPSKVSYHYTFPNEPSSVLNEQEITFDDVPWEQGQRGKRVEHAW